MAEIIRMPKMSDTMTEGVVSKWLKKVGDEIKSGDVLAEIETDKATMEFESYQSGTLLYIGVPDGKAAPVDGVLAVIGKPGEDFQSLLDEANKSAPKEETQEAPSKENGETKKTAASGKKEDAPQKTATKEAVAEKKEGAPKITAPVKPSSSSSDDGRIKASPLAKKLAEEKGIDLTKLKGTGDGGRVVKRDIDWFKPGSFVAGAPQTFVGTESFDEIQVSQMRKTIAKRLSESKFTAPHFYLTMEINMDRMMDARESINAISATKISFNDIVIKATAAALRQHPKVNASWQGNTIRMNHHINIGVAIAVEEGLLVPVVRFADGKTLSQIAAEVKEFSQKAKDKKLQPADWEGNTFTISNLGMFGIEEFTAIINTPDACILAVGGIKQTPLVINGKLRIGNVMKVTLSCDHRVVDGVTGSKFLQTLKGFLENPVILLGQNSI
ncbi:MAG TPA: pyruvate dehydrogenase complex dihydrolipoamide acetyltransferase [Bacteroidia bacterium]|nr:pyruvate dehydrogenase complex dihydrolipoamide acetyltransferase [Bacteroidia bacterium]